MTEFNKGVPVHDAVKMEEEFRSRLTRQDLITSAALCRACDCTFYLLQKLIELGIVSPIHLPEQYFEDRDLFTARDVNKILEWKRLSNSRKRK